MRSARVYAYYSGAWQDITKYSDIDGVIISNSLNDDLIGNGVGSFIDLFIQDNSETQTYIPYGTSTQIKITITDNGINYDFLGYTDPNYKKLTYRSDNIVYREVITRTIYDTLNNMNGHIGVGNVNVTLPGQTIDWHAIKGATHSFGGNWEEHILEKVQINGVYYYTLDGYNATMEATGVKVYNSNGEYITPSTTWNFDKIKFFTQNGEVVYPPVYMSVNDYINNLASILGYTVNSNLSDTISTDKQSFTILPTSTSVGGIRNYTVKYSKTFVHSGDSDNLHRAFILDNNGQLIEVYNNNLPVVDYIFNNSYNWEAIYINGEDVILVYKTASQVIIRYYTDIFHGTYTDYTYNVSNNWHILHHDGASYNDFVGDTVFKNNKIYVGIFQYSTSSVTLGALAFDISSKAYNLYTYYEYVIVSSGDGYGALGNPTIDYDYAVSCLGGIAVETVNKNSIVYSWYDIEMNIFRVGRAGSDTSSRVIIDDWSKRTLVSTDHASDMPEAMNYCRDHDERLFFRRGYYDTSAGTVILYSFGELYFTKWEDVKQEWVAIISQSDGGQGIMVIGDRDLYYLDVNSQEWEAYTHSIAAGEISGNYLWINGYGDKYPAILKNGDVIGFQYRDDRISDIIYYSYKLSTNAYCVYSFIDDIETSALDMLNRLGALFGFIWYIEEGTILYIKARDSVSAGNIFKVDDILRQKTVRQLSDYNTVQIGRYITTPVYGKVLTFGSDIHHVGLAEKQANYIKSLIDGKEALRFKQLGIKIIRPGEIWTRDDVGDIYITSVKVDIKNIEIEGLLL